MKTTEHPGNWKIGNKVYRRETLLAHDIDPEWDAPTDLFNDGWDHHITIQSHLYLRVTPDMELHTTN